MGTDGDFEGSSSLTGLNNQTSRLRVDGHTFWRATGRSASEAIELTTATGIELDETRCRWTVGPVSGAGVGQPVESASRDVLRFVGGVLAEMRRATKRATVRPVPKPPAKAKAPLPASAPVPCPLCQGEPWPDCSVCDGTGYVTQRRAAEWQEAHGSETRHD